MDNKVVIKISSHSVAKALGLDAVGVDVPITSVAPLSALSDESLSFCKNLSAGLWSKRATILCASADNIGLATAILSTNPRLDFARALNWINDNNGFARPDAAPLIHPSATVGNSVFIGNGAKIGAHTVIHHNVVIGSGVTIGDYCVVKSCAVIGEDGFGFERDGNGIPIRLVHLGGVQIGDHVEIGCHTTVCRGTLSDTVVENYVKVDDHVHIAHNVRLRRGAMVVACAEISGGVDVGEGAWIGPNASVIQQLKIGSGALVGIGANVIRDVDAGTTVAGNPAKVIVPR